MNILILKAICISTVRCFPDGFSNFFFPCSQHCWYYICKVKNSSNSTIIFIIRESVLHFFHTRTIFIARTLLEFLIFLHNAKYHHFPQKGFLQGKTLENAIIIMIVCSPVEIQPPRTFPNETRDISGFVATFLALFKKTIMKVFGRQKKAMRKILNKTKIIMKNNFLLLKESLKSHSKSHLKIL